MYQLLETIRIDDGEIQNMDYHQRRINQSSKELNLKGIDLDKIEVPCEFKKGKVKLRIIYSDFIENVEFQTYHIKKIHILKV